MEIGSVVNEIFMWNKIIITELLTLAYHTCIKALDPNNCRQPTILLNDLCLEVLTVRINDLCVPVLCQGIPFTHTIDVV